MHTKFVRLTAAWQRFLILPVLAALVVTGVFFAVRWTFGNSIAVYAQQTEVAQLAAEYAPFDPQTHHALGALNERTYLSDEAAVNINIDIAVGHYERAAALAPHDYRNWLILGKARERSGDLPGAEKAMRRAAELAPNYAQIRWTLGNFLLRRDRTNEALIELRRAAEVNQEFAAPVVDAGFLALGADNVPEIRRQLGDSPFVRTALLTRLIVDKRLDEALQMWNENNTDSEADRTVGGQLFAALLQNNRYRTALELHRKLTGGAADAVRGQIVNAGFETDIDVSGTDVNPFMWRIGEGAHPQISIDSVNKHGGSRSLVFNFNQITGNDIRRVSQLTAVNSNSRYRFETWARTGDLRTNNTVKWEILDARDNALLAATGAVPTGSTEWQPLRVDVTTRPNTEAVVIRLARVPCSATPCSITGRVWFDDFALGAIN